MIRISVCKIKSALTGRRNATWYESTNDWNYPSACRLRKKDTLGFFQNA